MCSSSGTLGQSALTASPELVVEILSPGPKNEERDRNLKLCLYSARGVREYWIVSPMAKTLELYRRDAGVLTLATTLYPEDLDCFGAREEYKLFSLAQI